MDDPYVLAITTYALTLANHAQKDTALQRLLAKAKKEGTVNFLLIWDAF